MVNRVYVNNRSCTKQNLRITEEGKSSVVVVENYPRPLSARAHMFHITSHDDISLLVVIQPNIYLL